MIKNLKVQNKKKLKFESKLYLVLNLKNEHNFGLFSNHSILVSTHPPDLWFKLN